MKEPVERVDFVHSIARGHRLAGGIDHPALVRQPRVNSRSTVNSRASAGTSINL